MKQAVTPIVVLGFLMTLNLMTLNAQGIQELSFGTDKTLDVMTWNIERFPKNQFTVDMVTDILTSLDADLVALQEIDDGDAFEDVVDGLEGWEGYDAGSGLAFLYKPVEIDVLDIYELFPSNNREFPREPLVMEFIYRGVSLVAINNHLKCCGDGLLDNADPWDEERRRQDAAALLDIYIDFSFSGDRVILLGDLNDELTDVPVHNVFDIFFDDPNGYLFADMEIAEGDSQGWSFPSWPSHLDHILITNELFDFWTQSTSHIESVRIDDALPGGFDEYEDKISDHRPVAMRIALNDGTTSAQDVQATDWRLGVSPNPVRDVVTMTFDPGANNHEVMIYDAMGQIAFSASLPGSQRVLQWPVQNQAPGVYYIVLQCDGMPVANTKFIISR